jgi:hypothetical protein
MIESQASSTTMENIFLGRKEAVGKETEREIGRTAVSASRLANAEVQVTLSRIVERLYACTGILQTAGPFASC